MGCGAKTKREVENGDTAEAAMALAKEISGEATSQLVHEMMRVRTHHITGLILRTLESALAEHKRDIADLVTAAGGSGAVSAAVEREAQRRARREAAIEATNEPEGVKAGDTFRVLSHPGLPVGSVGEVVEYVYGGIGIVGPGWRLSTTATVLLGPTWERVRVVEAPPVRAEVGDRFECMRQYECDAPQAGEVLTVERIDRDGDRWLVPHVNGRWCVLIDHLRDPAWWRPLPAPIAATTEGETSDLAGPAGDERIGLTAAGEAAAAWADDVAKLIEARGLIALRPTDPAAGYLDAAIAVLATRAGLLLPSKLPRVPSASDLLVSQ